MVTLNIFHFEEYGKGRIFQMVEWSAMRNSRLGSPLQGLIKGPFSPFGIEDRYNFYLLRFHSYYRPALLCLAFFSFLNGKSYMEVILNMYPQYILDICGADDLPFMFIGFWFKKTPTLTWGTLFPEVRTTVYYQRSSFLSLMSSPHGTSGFSPSRSAYCQQEREWTEYLVPRKTIVISDPT